MPVLIGLGAIVMLIMCLLGLLEGVCWIIYNILFVIAYPGVYILEKIANSNMTELHSVGISIVAEISILFMLIYWFGIVNDAKKYNLSQNESLPKSNFAQIIGTIIFISAFIYGWEWLEIYTFSHNLSVEWELFPHVAYMIYFLSVFIVTIVCGICIVVIEDCTSMGKAISKIKAAEREEKERQEAERKAEEERLEAERKAEEERIKKLKISRYNDFMKTMDSVQRENYEKGFETSYVIGLNKGTQVGLEVGYSDGYNASC